MGISFKVPGKQSYHIQTVVFDLNGTLMVDGQLRSKTRYLLHRLSEKVGIYILTADTQNLASRLQDIFGEKINVKILSGDHTSAAKRSFVKELGSGHVAAAGNGFNDVEMLEEAVLSIAVLEAEGCSPDILFKADIVVRSIDEAFMLLLKPKRLIATLRC